MSNYAETTPPLLTVYGTRKYLQQNKIKNLYEQPYNYVSALYINVTYRENNIVY